MPWCRNLSCPHLTSLDGPATSSMSSNMPKRTRPGLTSHIISITCSRQRRMLSMQTSCFACEPKRNHDKLFSPGSSPIAQRGPLSSHHGPQGCLAVPPWVSVCRQDLLKVAYLSMGFRLSLGPAQGSLPQPIHNKPGNGHA